MMCLLDKIQQTTVHGIFNKIVNFSFFTKNLDYSNFNGFSKSLLFLGHVLYMERNVKFYKSIKHSLTLKKGKI